MGSGFSPLKSIRSGAPPEERLRRRASRRRGRSRLIDRFRAEAERCRCDEDLRILLEEAARELGFAFFALLHHASLCSSSSGFIRLDNYPQGWKEEVLARGWARDDPVHHASARTNGGFAWTEIGELIPLSSRHREVLERSALYGIGAGFTTPANVPGEPGGSCSFAVRRGARFPERHLMNAELIGAHAFRAARRIHSYPAQGPRPHLNRRERQCLALIAAGKSDWEAARILGLSTETVRHYAKRARAAYDVVSRTQLVVHGLRDAVISFDEAIPPYR
jgi:LuxR family quorum-sensing system transcriptional regulator CciR